MGGIKNKLSKLSNKVKNLLTNGQFLPLDGEGGRRSLLDEVTKAEGFCFTNTPHLMATPSALPAVGEGNNKPPFRKRGAVPVALRVGVPLTSQRHDDSRHNNRISIGGVNKQDLLGKVNNKGSRLPSFSQPSKMPDGQISNTRKLSHLGLSFLNDGSLRPTSQSLPLAKGSQMSVAHRWGRITKYTSLACLTLAILSTITINLISTYSSSNIESNAESANIASSSDVATLANSSSLSLSFSNATGSCTDTSNPANVCMEIPDSGGIATGGHTVTVRAPADASGYELSVSSADGNASLRDVSTPENSFEIEATYGSVLSPSLLDPNDWGIALSSSADNDGIWFGSNDVLVSRESSTNQGSGDSYPIYYGAWIKEPSTIPAGTYSIDLVYALTVTLPSALAPTLSKLALNDTSLTGQTKEYALEGANLSTAYDVWVDFNDNGKKDSNESAANLATYPNTDKANTVISFINPASDTPGAYDIYVETYGGQAKLGKTYRVVKESICQSGNPNSDCQVDIDAHMIPVKYTGGTGEGGDGITAQWTVVAKNDTNNPGDWYDYSQKKWANAVTVKDYTKYQTPGTPISEDDVLGYWVYIPRYAYEVQRRDATDHYVDGKYALPDNVSTTTTDSHVIRNDFIIQFEKASDTPKEPTLGCSTLSGSTLNAKDYRTECNLNRTYGQATGTTWATHPAFRWKYAQAVNGKDEDKEVNGFWMGKYETTGTYQEPTVLPNRKAITESVRDDRGSSAGGWVGGYYGIAKSIGQPDPYNTGGTKLTTMTTSVNYHNMSTFTSYMTRNSDWGATTYLAFSAYGAGVENTQLNTQGQVGHEDACEYCDSDGYTGCGPYGDRD